jgi:hypothetical protein
MRSGKVLVAQNRVKPIFHRSRLGHERFYMKPQRVQRAQSLETEEETQTKQSKSLINHKATRFHPLRSLYYKPAESCNLDKNFGKEGSRESKEGRTILFFSASSAASCKVF